MTARKAIAGNATLGILMVVLGAAACDRFDDIADEVRRRHDAGGGPPPAACKVDSDCRTFSDMCTGCDCRALPVNDPDPVCGGTGVQCLIDPCQNQNAVCKAGQCAIQAKTVACASSTQCQAGTVCSTEAGVCNRPPGCGPNDLCPAVCYGTCEPTADPPGGAACGKTTCAAGTECCNASCGICTPPGGGCTKQFCG